MHNNREKIIELKKKRKFIKGQLNKIILAKRNELRGSPVQYNMMRLLTQATNFKPLRIRNKFDDKEIRTAKKCIVNGLERPPGFKNDILKMDNRSMISKSKKSSKAGGKKSSGMNAGQDLEDFEIDDMVLPAERTEGGNWVQKGDFEACF